MVQEVSAKSQKTLKTYYYEKGFSYGRDGLFELLKKKQPKSHPSKEEIELWLKQQKIAQLYAQTRNGGVTDTFKPPSTNASTLVRPSWRRDSLANRRWDSGPSQKDGLGYPW